MQRSFIDLLLILILAFGITENHAVQFQSSSGATAGEDFSSEERDEQVYRTGAAKRPRDRRSESARGRVGKNPPAFRAKKLSFVPSSQHLAFLADPHRALQILRI
jgi:hypothetical protein